MVGWSMVHGLTNNHWEFTHIKILGIPSNRVWMGMDDGWKRVHRRHKIIQSA